MSKNEPPRLYHIPVNIFDGVALFGIRLRYWIEAGIFAAVPAWLYWMFVPIKDLSVKIIIMLVISIPIGFAALVGYNGETMTGFVKTYLQYRKSRRVLAYTMLNEVDEVEGNALAQQEQVLSELGQTLADTRDKRKRKELKAQVKQLKTALDAEKAALRKLEQEDIAATEKVRDEKRAEEIRRSDELADAEIARFTEAGEKLDKKAVKQLRAQYREKYVSEMPKAPPKSKFTAQELSCQEFVPIDRIEGSCIITKGGRYLRILCVSPINFPMLSPEQQNYLIDNFALLLKGSPINIQIKTMAKSADVESFIERVQEKIEAEQSVECRSMMEDYIVLLRKNANQNAVSRQFFYIIEYDETYSKRNTSDHDRKLVLESAVQRARQYFRRCNNVVYEFANESDEVDFIYRMFFDILERFNGFGLSYHEKNKYAYGEVASTDDRELTAPDFIAPISIDLTHRKYVIIDGMYYGYMYIPSNGYRQDVGGSWLFSLINAGGGIDVDLFYERGDKDKVRPAARKQINLALAQMHDAQSNSDSFDNLESKASSASYIKNGLSNGEDYFYVTTLVTVIAHSEASLLQRMAAVTSLMEDMDMHILGCDFHQEDALLGTLPLCKCPPMLYELGRRNMLTTAAAATYPFSSYELIDDNGILIGTNISNGSLVMPDVFDTKRYKNANMYIIGSSGAGKTYNLMTQAMRSREAGIQTFILAPLKGFEFKRAVEAVGGQYIKLSPGSPHCINAMAIRKRDEEAAAINRLLDGVEDDSILSEKITSLETLFAIMVPDISNEEEQLLNGHIVETYKTFGITSDNRSMRDPFNPEQYREMPTLADLHQHMADDPHMARIRNIMSKYVTGSAKSFSQPTNVSLENLFTVVDVSALNKKMMPIGMFIALDFMWDKIKEDRTKAKRIFIDEIWHLMGAGAPTISAELCQEIFKTIRGFGAGATAVSQDLGDFFALNGGTYGKAILNACTLGMVMKTEHSELQIIRDVLGLEQREVEIIQSLERGQALILGGGNNVAVKVVTSPKEHGLFTTDRGDLQRMAMRLKEEETAEASALAQELTYGEKLNASRKAAGKQPLKSRSAAGRRQVPI